MTALPLGPFGTSHKRVILPGLPPIGSVLTAPNGSATIGIVHPVDILGLRPLYDSLLTHLATHGFANCAVDPFSRLEPATLVSLNLGERRQLVRELVDEDQLDDLARAAQCLRDEVGVQHVVLLGFCLGGYYTLKAAATGLYDAAVSCYGMIKRPKIWDADGHTSPMDRIHEVCPTLAVFGQLDEWTPHEEITDLELAWSDRPDCSVLTYDEADHGFIHSPDSPNHRATDAKDFWSRFFTFVQDTLDVQSTTTI